MHCSNSGSADCPAPPHLPVLRNWRVRRARPITHRNRSIRRGGGPPGPGGGLRETVPRQGLPASTARVQRIAWKPRRVQPKNRGRGHTGTDAGARRAAAELHAHPRALALRGRGISVHVRAPTGARVRAGGLVPPRAVAGTPPVLVRDGFQPGCFGRLLSLRFGRRLFNLHGSRRQRRTLRVRTPEVMDHPVLRTRGVTSTHRHHEIIGSAAGRAGLRH